MPEWTGSIPPMDWALITGLLVSSLVTLLTRRRGGRFRGLLGWLGFWLLLGGILVALSRWHPWISLTLLGLLMFAALRTYFFVAPVRPRDRYAVLAAYLSIPFVLVLGVAGSSRTFLATVPILLFLVFPVLLSMGRAQEGLLDSMGRILLGVLLFVFCAAHLGLVPGLGLSGLPELFGILVLAAELPQRLAGRPGRSTGRLKAGVGMAASAVLATGMGFWLGPWCGLTDEDGARAGFLVTIAVSMGACVAHAVVRDLALGSTATRVGRGAFLDRAIPAVYAAPVFFHYLDHFA